MEHKIIGGLLVKNEADRWLREFLASFDALCDEIIILDDGSTDDDKTPEMCNKYGTVYLSKDSYWETREWMQREALFGLCCNAANFKDWIIILDADEILNNAEGIRKILKEDITSNTFALRLFDMWNDSKYRDDEFWSAHKRLWPMAIRKQQYINYTWNKAKLHCGRLPVETDSKSVLVDEKNYIKHMGWSTEKDRKIKHDRYMKIDGNGVFGWLDQYKSILDKNPNLVELEENTNV